MKSEAPFLVDERNLSTAWARTFLQIMDNPGKEISPLVLSLHDLTNESVAEDTDVRKAMDTALQAIDEQEVQTVANTIFPASLWRFAGGDRARLYRLFLKNVPRYKALAKSKNRDGMYFERLVSFDGTPEGNQLEHIISTYKARPGVRRSMFQAAIFDPIRDHKQQAQMGFPCLHAVSFVPGKQGLAMNAFYATQQVLHKAYGNVLGLVRLGQFVATEMELELRRLNCFIGVAKLDTQPKSQPALTALVAACRNLVAREALSNSRTA